MNTLLWILLIIAAIILLILIFGYRRAAFPRQAGVEGLESAEVTRAYDRISRWPQFKLLRSMIVHELKTHNPTGTLVDVGCGPGYLVAAITRSVPRLRIIGVDISAEMVRQAGDNTAAMDLSERVSFKLGNAQKLPFADNDLDFIMSSLSLHHWSEPEEVLREIHRVLKPGGQFLIFDLRRDARRMFYWLIRFAQTFVVPSALRNAGEPTGSALSSYTPAELQTIISLKLFRKWQVKPGFGWMFISGNK